MQHTCIKTLPSINYNSFHERATHYYILFTLFGQNKTTLRSLFNTLVRERGLSALGLLRSTMLEINFCARSRYATSRSLCSLMRFCVIFLAYQ